MDEGETHPTLAFGTQYSGGGVDGTQDAKSCYIVRRHQILLLKCAIFIKNYKKRDMYSIGTRKFRALTKLALILHI